MDELSKMKNTFRESYIPIIDSRGWENLKKVRSNSWQTGIKIKECSDMIKNNIEQMLKHKYLYNVLIKQSEDHVSNIYFVNVDPQAISHISLLPESASRLTGKEAFYGSFSGVFDMLKKPFKNDFMYLTVQQLLNGDDWETTPYYRKLLQYKSHEETIAHYQKLEELIKTLSQDGYMSQYELGRTTKTTKIFKWKVPKHEMVIGMDRWGQLFRIKGGRHRLAIAQNLGLEKIPAILMLYHENAGAELPVERRVIEGQISDFIPFKEVEYAIE